MKKFKFISKVIFCSTLTTCNFLLSCTKNSNIESNWDILEQNLPNLDNSAVYVEKVLIYNSALSVINIYLSEKNYKKAGETWMRAVMDLFGISSMDSPINSITIDQRPKNLPTQGTSATINQDFKVGKSSKNLNLTFLLSVQLTVQTEISKMTSILKNSPSKINVDTLTKLKNSYSNYKNDASKIKEFFAVLEIVYSPFVNYQVLETNSLNSFINNLVTVDMTIDEATPGKVEISISFSYLKIREVVNLKLDIEQTDLSLQQKVNEMRDDIINTSSVLNLPDNDAWDTFVNYQAKSPDGKIRSNNIILFLQQYGGFNSTNWTDYDADEFFIDVFNVDILIKKFAIHFYNKKQSISNNFQEIAITIA